MGRSPPQAMLSIDVDDLLVANLDFAGEPRPRGYAPRVTAELAATLAVLRDLGARATIFVNAQYADALGGLLDELVDEGHVLGSHGFGHHDVQRLPLDAFRTDLCRSLERLRRHQDPILGYRAPGFSIPYDPPHFEVLLREGLRYLSNGVGVARSDAPAATEAVEVFPGLLHVPISTRFLVGGLKLALGYGATVRLLPQALALGLVRRELQRPSPFHFYFHPFELAGADRTHLHHIRDRRRQLAARIFALRCRAREDLFRRLLGSAAFAPIETVLADRLAPEGGRPPVAPQLS